MEWKWLISVLIALAWIIGSLLRKNQEERRAARPRVPDEPGPPAAEKPPRQASTDIDRFLEEVNRRRRQAAERGSEGSSRREPTAAAPPAKPAPPRPRPQPAKPGAEAGPRPVPVARPVQERGAREPVVVAEVVPVSRPPGVVPKPEPVVGRLDAPAPAPAPTGTPRADLVRLVALLRSPQTLRATVMLREIFDPPLCRRRGRR